MYVSTKYEYVCTVCLYVCLYVRMHGNVTFCQDGLIVIGQDGLVVIYQDGLRLFARMAWWLFARIIRWLFAWKVLIARIVWWLLLGSFGGYLQGWFEGYLPGLFVCYLIKWFGWLARMVQWLFARMVRLFLLIWLILIRLRSV